MKRSTIHRLGVVEGRLRTAPVQTHAVAEARRLLQEQGQWPQDRRVGAALIGWLLTGVDSTRFSTDPAGHAAYLVEAVNRPAVEHDPVMRLLWSEATWATEPFRKIARRVLFGLWAAGWDPTTPTFPERGISVRMTCTSMALTLLDVPGMLARSPWADRAEHVFATFDELRQQVCGDGQMVDRIQVECDRFAAGGELPGAGIERRAVLADCELRALLGELANAGRRIS